MQHQEGDGLWLLEKGEKISDINEGDQIRSRFMSSVLPFCMGYCKCGGGREGIRSNGSKQFLSGE